MMKSTKDLYKLAMREHRRTVTEMANAELHEKTRQHCKDLLQRMKFLFPEA